MCFSTVRLLSTNSSAISPLVLARAISVATSRSRSVNPSRLFPVGWRRFGFEWETLSVVYCLFKGQCRVLSPLPLGTLLR